MDFFTNFNVVSGVIGSLATVLLTIAVQQLQQYYQRMKKPAIYYKLINSREWSGPWGIYNDKGNRIFVLPIKFDILNTSSMNKVVRDLAVYAYMNDQQVAKFKQIESSGKVGDDISNPKFTYGEDNGSYSFNIPPNLIVHRKVHYALKMEKSPPFNKLRIGYYDEKDNYREYFLLQIDSSEKMFKGKISPDWRKLGTQKNGQDE